MDELALRPYQDEAIGEVFGKIHEGKKRLAIVLPTGSGKTVIFSYMIRHWHSTWHMPGRSLVLVHRDELVNQAVKKLYDIAPHLNVGIVQAGQNEHAGKDVIVGSVQTLRNLARLDDMVSSGRIGLVVVDECHHATAASYRTIMRELGCYDEGSGALALGFTATLTRNDSTSLGDVWQEVAYRKDILDLIMPDKAGNKYLCNVRGKRVEVNGLSLEDVAMKSGDYEAGSLGKALLSSDAPDFVADAWIEHAKDKPGMLFTPTVETAMAFSDALNAKGITAQPIWGAMNRDDRRVTLGNAFKERTQVLVNCMVLTEGFDWPRAEVSGIARPTTSAGLYIQMAGRALRLHPDKNEALILDFVGASQDHRLATIADLTSRRIELVYPDESLLDAVLREQKVQNPALKDYIITWQDVNLFEGSKAAWNKTYKGIWFISTKEWVHFLWPGSEPGMYDVGLCSIRGSKWERLHKNIPLELAMSWAETEAFGADSDTYLMSLSRRDASWRRKKEKPSEKQINYAKGLGLVVPEGALKRDVSDMIDRHLISRLLDKKLRQYV